MNKNSNWLTHRFSGGKKIALFMLPPLSLGLGAEKYFIELVRNLQIRELGADVVTMDEKFYQKFARALHIFFSLNFFKSIDISGHESEGWVKKNLGQSKWIKTSFKNLANTLQKYDLIYSKNEIADLLLLKLIGFKNLPPIVVGVHTPILYPRANSFSAKLHNFLYSSLFFKWLLNLFIYQIISPIN